MTTATNAHAVLDRAKIDEIVEGVRKNLRDDYGVAASPRFPFGLHHACARSRIREPITRRYLKQAEIAAYLAEWAAENGGASAYAWQSISLATEEISATRKTESADKVLDRAKKALEPVPPFLSWMKNRLLASKQPQA